ncbi:MAG: hypothetical protein UR39_C0005G0043 [Candidatus Woesebacteria bacterium GW2011_GWA1_33_30]|uniref:Uncharacterized protein n=1 Tax=Candidatus Woesebacteria bacterium GW2011_GWA2_33_28 TaxID=1618561 RepID=A0A0G0C7L3_9BACT|nr:MAG: hypothetical protein UR38_C0005G0043 [Candidatus Woesebacteria bacterium GW2011_GWA2_33_28]KKP48161.1 MAG: hypothetical protein UR39_C0005G0043 [Candidatus Woesebacteria bacterium GW2011_GWA1_33_30]KKP49403.1 MAG: hypothetical protein UR40_C0006G0043 [Microgenomates group bacterium GW2011_GWC1_33_32]KKP52129.1 MAG: hypothetical protein UR44_C0004G0043 [Candidatus Woesebacteria bacterium GW2011_GWB1_33_38]
MIPKIRITISTERGNHIIEVDPHVAGSLANGAMEEYEQLYDGHGNLINQENAEIAKDLVTADGSLRQVFNETVGSSKKS